MKAQPKSGIDIPAADPCGGLYVHIPFCLQKCPYCDFFSVTDRALIPRFVDALCAEMQIKRYGAPVFDTLYMGGGTPSLLDAKFVDKIIGSARASFTIRPGAEITLEVNPGTVDIRRLADYRSAGVNRLNIGIQSFEDRSLEFLGRIHSARQGRQAVAWAQQAGFEHLGLDLIYGLPEQTREGWQTDLRQAVELGPEHLSCYLLTIEPGTPMAEDLGRGRFDVLPEVAVAGLFETTQSLLHAGGYIQYEISNFARTESAMSRHNRKYWTFAPYDGLGPAAHSFRSPTRWWNHRSLDPYLQDIENGRAPVAGKEVLGREQRIIEMIYLGLRTAEGVDIRAFNRTFDMDFFHRFSEPMAALTEAGLLVSADLRCFLTPAGMCLHEGIARMFIEYA